MGIMQKMTLRGYYRRAIFYIIPDHIMRTNDVTAQC